MSIIFHRHIKQTPNLKEIIKNAPVVKLSDLQDNSKDKSDDIIIELDSTGNFGRADVLISKKTISREAYEILHDFKEAQRTKNDITGDDSFESDNFFNRKTETCIDGNKVKIFSEKSGETLTASLTSSQGKSLLNLNFNIGEIIDGDSEIIKEYKKMLNGKPITIESFKEYIKSKELEYIENNKEEAKAKIEQTKNEIEEILTEKREDLANTNKANKTQILTKEEIEDIFYPWKKQQFYRIVGKEELTKLLNGETITNQRPGRVGMDITNNPNYHRIFYGEEKFRVPFKKIDSNGDRFSSRVREVEASEEHFSVGSYDINDVDIKNIAFWNGSSWEKYIS